jgi:hypothetical protein
MAAPSQIAHEQQHNLLYAESQSRRFVVTVEQAAAAGRPQPPSAPPLQQPAAAAAADAAPVPLYLVLSGEKTLRQLRGAIQDALNEAAQQEQPHQQPPQQQRVRTLWHVVGGRRMFLASGGHARLTGGCCVNKLSVWTTARARVEGYLHLLRKETRIHHCLLHLVHNPTTT